MNRRVNSGQKDSVNSVPPNRNIDELSKVTLTPKPVKEE